MGQEVMAAASVREKKEKGTWVIDGEPGEFTGHIPASFVDGVLPPSLGVMANSRRSRVAGEGGTDIISMKTSRIFHTAN